MLMTAATQRGSYRIEPEPCRTLLAREQQRMRSEYEQRLRDLESERLTAEHDKAKARHTPVVPQVCHAAAGLQALFGGRKTKLPDAATGCSPTIFACHAWPWAQASLKSQRAAQGCN